MVANFQSLASLGIEGVGNWDVTMFLLLVACMNNLQAKSKTGLMYMHLT
jgi:hypothetical protein